MGSECSGSVPLVEIDVGLLADQVGVSTTHSLDLGQGVHNLLFSFSHIVSDFDSDN